MIMRGTFGVVEDVFTVSKPTSGPRWEVVFLGEVLGVRGREVDGSCGISGDAVDGAFCRVGDTGGDERAD